MQRTTTILALTVLIGGCATARQAANETAETAREVTAEVIPGPKAHAELLDAQGTSVGRVNLEQEEDGVDMGVDVSGLPAGTHGIHIHEVGSCVAPDFTSAGGHFNPTSKQHGFDNPMGPHAGDLRNIEVAADGTGEAKLEDERVIISEGSNSLFDADGSSVVVHAGPDDYRSDPSGNSGARIACGVIVRD